MNNKLKALHPPIRSLSNNRRHTRTIRVGSVAIGGGAPISVQTMTKTPTHNAQATIRQILELEKIECDIVRVAVPDMQSARALRMIKKAVHIPLVADIHFDHSPRQTRKYFGTRNTLCQQSDIHTA